MDRAEYAVERKHGGLNCCQAVLAAFSDRMELPEETLLKMGACFAVGMGSMEATCGSLCGAQMLLGLDRYGGKSIVPQARALAEAFRQQTGALTCREIKGVDTGKVLCPCDDCVQNAVRLLEAALEQK